MKLFKNILNSVKPHFENGGKLEKLYPAYDAFETFLFVPDHTSNSGAHMRDAIDLKRTMFTVVLALIPALIFGMWNVGYQHFLALGLTKPDCIIIWLFGLRIVLKNFHFAIYPVNQNKEFNFISIIRKKLAKKQINNQNYFKQSDFIETLIDEILLKTPIKLKDRVECLKSFPIFVSDSFNKPNKKNVFLVGDALYAFPPSFAQGASQSIESSKEAYDEIENNTDIYYINRSKKIKKINSRSMLNHFTFHLSNPFMVFVRNNFLKYLSRNNSFLENYLGRIYRN